MRVNTTVGRAAAALGAVAVALSLLIAVPTSPALADPIPGETWVANGAVDAMVIANGKVYLGGEFSQIGPNTGGGADVNITSGVYNSASARIDGAVHAVVSDGSGGWFIGGDFSFVDGLSRPRVAHIGAAGQVTAWRPAPTTGSVNALFRNGADLYIGGEFDMVLGEARQNLAAVDISTENAMLLAWDPGADGIVHAMVGDATATGVYVAGEFAMAGGASRGRLAHLELATGSPSPWAPSADGPVRALDLDATTVYVGGDFATLDAVGRASVGAVDAVSGVVTGWNPGTDGSVAAITANPGVVYLGGAFATVAGTSRANLAAVDRTSGNATSWDPAPDGAVSAVAVSGTDVLLGGAFRNVAGVERSGAASVTAAGVAGSFDPGANDDVAALAVAGARVYLGGFFSSVNGVDRPYLAALDATTGVLDMSWDPVANARVRALEASADGSVIFIGGEFTTINGGDHRRIAAVNATTGVIDGTFSAQADNQVRALHQANGVLYLGGDFGSVSSTPRTRLAAVDEVTGAIAPTWDPAADDSVRAIASSPDGSLIYIGGMFDLIDGQSRNEIAAVESGTGNLSAVWNPDTNRRVYQFEVTPDEVLVAMGGAGGRAYSFDPVTGAENWFVEADGDVQAVASRGATAYFGGHFLAVGAELRDFFFASDLATGALDSSWAPQGLGGLGPFVMSEDSGHIWAGGEFTKVEGRSAARVTYLDAVVFTAPGSYRDRVIADGADVFYRFGEQGGTTAIDDAGVIDATYGGNVTLGSGGLITGANTAVGLDGATARVAIPDSGLINTGGPYEERSVELWFRTGDATPRQMLFEEGGISRGINIYVENGSVYFGAWNTTDHGDGTTPWSAPVFLAAPVTANQTHHAVLSFDYPSGVLTAYLDGVPVAAATAIGRLFAHADNVAAGAVDGTTRIVSGGSSALDHFSGTLDELAIYNEALAESTVTSHYLLGTIAGPGPAAVVVSPDDGDAVTGSVAVVVVAEDGEDAAGTLVVDVSTDGGGTWNPAPYQSASSTYQFIWDTTAEPAGPVTLIARATDSDTNQGTSSPVTVTVDNLNNAPTAAVTAPAEGSTVGGLVSVDVEATDVEDAAGSLDVAVRFDGGPWQPAAWDGGTSRYKYGWDTIAEADGAVLIEARAIDSGSAETISSPVSVTVANATGYVAAVLADNPVVYWRFDETGGVVAADEVDALAASYVNGVAVGATGLIGEGRSVELEGVDDYVWVVDSPLINEGDPIETRSVELWFNAQDTTNRQVLFEEGGFSRGLNIYIEEGLLYFGAWNLTNDGDGTTPWSGGEAFLTAPIVTGQTYHVVLTFDQPSDLLIGYLDGVAVTSRGEIGRLYPHSAHTGIGAMINRARFHTGNEFGHGAYLDGQLDELAIYDSVLSPARVRAHHAAGL